MLWFVVYLHRTQTENKDAVRRVLPLPLSKALASELGCHRELHRCFSQILQMSRSHLTNINRSFRHTEGLCI